MKYTVPDYYHEFQCIASECPATCCAGWQIVIDDQSLNKYKNLKTPFGNRLINSIDWDEKTFVQYEKRCAFLNEENLCDIYTEAGPDYLCKTCRRYPRHIEEFDNERELSLSLSCPVVAEMLLGKTERASFIEKENDKTEPEDEEFDLLLYSELQECRKVIVSILQNRQLGIKFRMAKVLALAHDIQNRINSEHVFEIENVLERYQRDGGDEILGIKFSNFQLDSKRNRQVLFKLLEELEVLDNKWPGQLKKYQEILFSDHMNSYSEKVKKALSVWHETKKTPLRRRMNLKNQILVEPEWREIESEQLLVYFIYTYFCGGIYDGDILSKTKMAIVSTLMLRDMETAWQAEHDEMITLKDRAEIVWKYSRELEHSDPNLNKMEELLCDREEMEFKKLLSLVFA